MANLECDLIVYVDGVYDMFHRGHIEFFKKARTFGGTLIVGVLSDEDVATYKRRPMIRLEDRAEIVRQCRLVDRVIVGSPLFVSEELLDLNHVDIVVHGNDNKYPDVYEIPIRRNMMRYVPYWRDCSTTSIIETVKTSKKSELKND